MTENKFSNDATPKILGIEYQKLIALECCLDAKRNEHIWIECKGDVANAETSMEIKHHITANNITSNSVDVWKTIGNYIKEFEIVEQFSSLVLHTTSIAQSDSIFYDWNKLTAKGKESKLKGHLPSSTIIDFHKLVLEFNDQNLLKILGKFKIIESQLDIKNKWEELKEHATFTIIPENFRESALQKLIGYITKKAIDNSDEWKVNINDFNRDIQVYLSVYTKGNTPFPIINIKEIDIDKKGKRFVFIDKMKIINVHEKDQANAIEDFLRANVSQTKLIYSKPTLSENLDEYDNNIMRAIGDEKSNKAIGITIVKLNTEEVHNISKKLYFECIKKPHDGIIGVDNTQKYYRDGRIHHTLEETEFEWKFNQDDL